MACLRFVLHALTHFFQSGGLRWKPFGGGHFRFPFGKAVKVPGSTWCSRRALELGEGFAGLYTKSLTLRGRQWEGVPALSVRRYRTTRGGGGYDHGHEHPSDVCRDSDQGRFWVFDEGRSDSSVVADPGECGNPVMGSDLTYQYEHSPPGARKRWHASEETVYMWGKSSTAPAWEDLDKRLRFKARAWLGRLPEIFNTSFENYRYKIVRVKQKNGK